jgi:hypothetical protein
MRRNRCSASARLSTGPEQPLRTRYLGNAYYALATVDRAMGKWQNARDHAQTALDTWKQGSPELDPKNRVQAAAILAEAAAHLAGK